MNIKRFLLTSLVGFIFVAVYEFIVHEMLLGNAYQATEHLWRPEEEMLDLFPLIFLFQILLVVIVGFIFTRHYEEKGIMEGVRFGTYIGALLALTQAAMYPYYPLPLSLIAAWIPAAFIEGVGIGVVFALVYRK